jgi:hypothetical protein
MLGPQCFGRAGDALHNDLLHFLHLLHLAQPNFLMIALATTGPNHAALTDHLHKSNPRFRDCSLAPTARLQSALSAVLTRQVRRRRSCSGNDGPDAALYLFMNLTRVTMHARSLHSIPTHMRLHGGLVMQCRLSRMAMFGQAAIAARLLHNVRIGH